MVLINKLGHANFLSLGITLPLCFQLFQHFTSTYINHGDHQDHFPIHQRDDSIVTNHEAKDLSTSSSTRFIHTTHFPYVINNDSICGNDEIEQGNQKIDLLIFVTSSVGHKDRRDAIRNTWALPQNQRRLSYRVVFVLGRINSDDDDDTKKASANEESKANGDIIQKDFKDTYRNLTLKSVAAIDWVDSHCSQANWILKTDDDIYVNVEHLIKNLNEFAKTDHQVIGCLKNRIDDTFHNPLGQRHVYPLFAAGAGYLIRGKRYITTLYEAMMKTRYIPVEDVFVTGFAAQKAGMHPPLHDARFSCGEQITVTDDDGAFLCRLFTIHKIQPDQMYKLHDLSTKTDSCVPVR